MTQAEYGFSSIWDFNLRDVLKWCELMIKFQVRNAMTFKINANLSAAVVLQKATHWAPGQFVELVYCSRLRTAALRSKVLLAVFVARPSLLLYACRSGELSWRCLVRGVVPLFLLVPASIPLVKQSRYAGSVHNGCLAINGSCVLQDSV